MLCEFVYGVAKSIFSCPLIDKTAAISGNSKWKQSTKVYKLRIKNVIMSLSIERVTTLVLGFMFRISQGLWSCWQTWVGDGGCCIVWNMKVVTLLTPMLFLFWLSLVDRLPQAGDDSSVSQTVDSVDLHAFQSPILLLTMRAAHQFLVLWDLELELRWW